MEFVRIKPDDIAVGSRLPWSVYCTEKALLLQEGTLVANERQRHIILERGIYRNLTHQEIEARKAAPEPANETPVPRIAPFRAKEQWTRTLSELLPRIEDGNATKVTRTISSIAVELHLACEQQADAILAAVHLSRGVSYTAVHPIHAAILCELLGRRVNCPKNQRLRIIAAALTMNVGMLRLQDELFQQKTSLTEEQKSGILEHPQRSVELLKQAGVTDSTWLDAILHHHERINGSGYPAGLNNEQICGGARIIALADMYAALVTPRIHRAPIVAQDALKTVFAKRGNEVDDTLANQLIREVGVFPPGTTVRLVNGEIAVVSRRAIVKKKRDSTAPIVHSLVSPRGGLYDQPVKRDCSNVLFKISESAASALPEAANPEAIWDQAE